MRFRTQHFAHTVYFGSCNSPVIPLNSVKLLVLVVELQCIHWGVENKYLGTNKKITCHRGRGFNVEARDRSGPVYVRFVVDKATVGQVFHRVLRFCLASITPRIPCTHFRLKTTLIRGTILIKSCKRNLHEKHL